MQEEDIINRRDDAEGRYDAGGHYRREGGMQKEDIINRRDDAEGRELEKGGMMQK